MIYINTPTSASKTNEMPLWLHSSHYLHKYKECLRRQAELRKALALPKDEKEDHEFCKQHYKHYVAKLVVEAVL